MIKDFLYLDNELLRSLLSQFEEGLTESTSSATENKANVAAKVKGKVPLIVELGGEGGYGYSRSQHETKSAHHYAFKLLHEHITKNNLVDESGDKPFVLMSGTLRFIDGHKIAKDMKKVPSLVKGLEAAMSFSDGDQNVDVEEMNKIAESAEELGDLIDSLTGGNLMVRIGSKYIYLDRTFVHSNFAPELMTTGAAYGGGYELIGIPSRPIEDTDHSDPIIGLVDAFSKIESSLIQVSPIKPLAIYKTLN